MKTTNKLQKRNNADSGKKAHNDNQFIKVGRIRMNSWATAKLPVADIYISERELVHIKNRRGEALGNLGFTAQTYIETIIQQFNEIRKDERGAYFFIVKGVRIKNSDLEKCAVVELEYAWYGQKHAYIIKSARPMNWGRLQKIEFVCDKPRS